MTLILYADWWTWDISRVQPAIKGCRLCTRASGIIFAAAFTWSSLIGRRSVSDLGAIGDNLIPALGGGNASGQHDQLFNSQALEAAYRKLPLPKDSERPRSYIPVNFLLSSALEYLLIFTLVFMFEFSLSF